MTTLTAAQATDLVAANRILVRQGVLDAFGHVSVRTAPRADTFWLSRNLAPGSVTASDLLEHDLDGRTDDPRRPYLERFIHAEIYRRRPDVMAVVHSHSPSVVPFSVVDTGLRPVLHMAGFLGGRTTPVFEISDVAGDASDLLITSSSLSKDPKDMVSPYCCLTAARRTPASSREVPGRRRAPVTK